MKNWLKNLLDKLAKANEDTFKGQRMDCCDLNRINNSPSGKQIKK